MVNIQNLICSEEPAPRLRKAPEFSTYCRRIMLFKNMIGSEFARVCRAMFFVTWSHPIQEKSKNAIRKTLLTGFISVTLSVISRNRPTRLESGGEEILLGPVEVAVLDAGKLLLHP